MKKNRPFVTVGYVGIILLALGLFLMSSFPKYVPYMADGFKTPIIYFEFVETIEQTQQLFGMTKGLLPDSNLIQPLFF